MLNQFDGGHISHSRPVGGIEKFDALMHQTGNSTISADGNHSMGVTETTNGLLIARLMEDTVE